MKFVNPIGRTPGSGVQPRACMCTDGYAGYRGNDDGCVHCGCGCGGEGEYRTGNRVNAVATFRSLPMYLHTLKNLEKEQIYNSCNSLHQYSPNQDY